MGITIVRMINHPAYAAALSSDYGRIAISGSKDVAVYSLIDYTLIQKIPVKNASSMVFLSDNCSMLILNTTGSWFLWDGIKLKHKGKWPVPQWREDPLHYADDAHIFWSGSGGIWCFDAITCSIKLLFSTDDRTIICSCSNGIIKYLSFVDSSVDERYIRIAEMLFDGTVLYTNISKQQVQARRINLPAWSEDGIIAVSTIAAPMGLERDVTAALPYEFTTKGRACVKEAAEWVQPWSPPHAVMYLMDREGNVLRELHSNANDGGNLFCGHGLLAKSCFSARSVSFMTISNLEMVGIIGENDLVYGIEPNPPTFVLFLPKKRILVGSWNKLFVCQCVPQILNASK